MEVATVLNVHKPSEIIVDTLDSILTYVSDKVLVLIDGKSWDSFNDYPLNTPKLKGFSHGIRKAPFRNTALGLSTLFDHWPEADWYCYCEYDVLFGSNRFLHNLRMAEEKNVWMLGNAGRIDEVRLPMIESLIGSPFKSVYYLLGCCLFFHRKFLEKLKELDFFPRFLNLTNNFDGASFPGYAGYDLSEHLYPTMCRHMGGNIGVFATCDDNMKWHGSYRHFPMRFRPALDPETENFPEASIMHPLKTFDHPIRCYHRERRLQWKNSNKKAKQLGLSSISLPGMMNPVSELLMA